jgi:CheY-like chemotaxis protein
LAKNLQSASLKANMDFSKLTVWVVEDDLQSWAIVSRLLEAVGVTDFTVTVKAETVMEAMSKGVNIDIILIDVHIKSASGYDLLNDIKNNPRYQTTKGIMISASTGALGIRQAQAAHADGFISKPLTVDKLKRAFNRVLEGRGFWE